MVRYPEVATKEALLISLSVMYPESHLLVGSRHLAERGLLGCFLAVDSPALCAHVVVLLSVGRFPCILFVLFPLLLLLLE